MRCMSQVQLIVGLAAIDSGTEHAEHVEPGCAAIIHAVPNPRLAGPFERNPNVGAQAGLASLKALGRDTVMV